MDRETDFRDNNGNVEAQTSWESGLSNRDKEWDVKIIYNRENDFNTEDQEIGANSNEEILIDKAIQATIKYSGLDFIVLNI